MCDKDCDIIFSMLIGIILGSIFLTLLIALFAFLFWIYKKYFYSPKKGRNDESRLDGM